ncbi:MAG TPA: homocysteine biosynthesis protein [Planctomycetota bacterium]|nr:homocysteine biosynthesis protein [Planctomycetota bacterium]
MPKTIAEINEKIRKGQVTVVTAEEMVGIVAKKGPKGAARDVDVVTTGTFGAMCSSGAFLNFGHTTPRMKMQKVWLNEVPAYAGFAAVDVYIGATETPEGDPLNSVFPGPFRYGGGHVIEDLVAGKEVAFRATGYGTDCYPRREAHGYITLSALNEAVLVNPRNGYQNYNCAVNVGSQRTIYTYMGILRPKMANANYATSGQLSPLLNDPTYRTIGIGTRIFLGGTVGYVYWQGTQHNPGVPRNEHGIPRVPAGTIAVCGDLKRMSTDFIRGVSYRGYGTSLAVGLGIPIPVLDEDMARATGIGDADIVTKVIDYGHNYPQGEGKPLGEVTYAELKSGKINVNGKDVPTASLSSYRKSRDIAGILKTWIEKGDFLLTDVIQPLPGPDSDCKFHGIKLRQKDKS